MKEQFITVTKLTFSQEDNTFCYGYHIHKSNDEPSSHTSLPLLGEITIGKIYNTPENFLQMEPNIYQKCSINGKPSNLNIIFKNDRFILKKSPLKKILQKKENIV